MDFFDRCSNNLAYKDLEESNGDKQHLLYIEIRKVLKRYYSSPIDMTRFFIDPTNEKHCWYHEEIDFLKYGLNWEQALHVLYSVYADCPLLFFSDIYKAGGDPGKGIIIPVVDNDSSRGDFRNYYASKIEEEVVYAASSLPYANKKIEIAKAVYDLMSLKASYDFNKARHTGYVDIPSHSILGYVRSKCAVCEGFSKTYQVFMNYLGLPTVTVSGMLFQDDEQKIKSGNHARNITYLSDEKRWIMVDPTEGIVSKDNRGFDISPHSKHYRRLTQEEKKQYESNMYSPSFDGIWFGYKKSVDNSL